MPGKPKNDERSETRAELDELLDKLDETALGFLKQQAEILLYSGELEEARKKAVAAAQELKRAKSSGGSRPAADSAGGGERDDAEAADVEQATPQADGSESAAEAAVRITRRGDTSFFITITGTRVFFNRQEMREMTRIAHAAGDASDGARRLHRWLSKERSDVVKDIGASGAGDPRLGELWRVIVSTYKAD